MSPITPTNPRGMTEGTQKTDPSQDESPDYNLEDRIFSFEELKPLNLLVHPIWVFDLVERRMRWANSAGVAMWNADTLEELQNRDFRDISPASVKRMEDHMDKCGRGLNITEQWTMYPKGKANTVHMNVSAIKFSHDQDHWSLMCEGIPIVNNELLNDNLRGVEMLRHLPMAVCQFDINGKVLFQNPEAFMTKTGDDDIDDSSSHTTEQPEPISPEMDENASTTTTSSGGSSRVPHKRKRRSGDLVSRFVDPEVGRQILRDIQSAGHVRLDLEATVHTHSGDKWSAIQVSKVNDPITGDPVILYSARDKSDAVQARKERQAREQKSEFLAIMAHEIRTPLHQVMGFIDLLDQTSLDTEQKSYVKLLKSSARGLMTVISDVLDYSKLEAGKMKLECIPYEPLSVVEGSMAVVRTDCEDKGLYLNFEWNKAIPFKLMGDPNRLRQILLNLLSNAVKFTKIGGITVQAFPTTITTEDDKSPPAVLVLPPTNGHCTFTPKSMIKFVVKDTGMGIKADYMDVIFRKYQQADVSVARNFGGTGLGLSICQILVQHMGGSIGVESVWGEGASFWFVLPADVPKESDSVEVVTEEATDDDGGLRVLVAEDNRVNQKLVSKMLKRMGHHASIAMNGKEAIEMIEKEEYDVVLMDIQMPVMDGLEATRRLRTLGYTELPIFGLTASVARSNFEDLGFNDWIAKPIPMQDLKAKLYRLKRSHLMSVG